MGTKVATPSSETITLGDLDQAAARRIRAAGEPVRLLNTGLSLVPDELLVRMKARERLRAFLDRKENLAPELTADQLLDKLYAEDRRSKKGGTSKRPSR